MSNQPAPQQPSLLKNPQIILAVISGIVTLLAAIIGVLPHLLPATPTPTVTPIVVTATVLPSVVPVATNSPTAETKVSEPVQPTVISLLQPSPNVAPTMNVNGTPNVKLLYDKSAFNVLNQSNQVLSLAGVVFRSTSGTWDATAHWGVSLISLRGGHCLRLRDASAGEQKPPAICGKLLDSLLEVGTSAMFWVNTDHFDVIRNDQTIATCDTAANECDVYIPLA